MPVPSFMIVEEALQPTDDPIRTCLRRVPHPKLEFGAVEAGSGSIGRVASRSDLRRQAIQ